MSRSVIILSVLASLIGGCVSAPSAVTLDTAGVEPSADVAELAAVLADCLDARGRVLPAKLQEHQGELDAQLKRLAVTGPRATPELYPTADARLTYAYNAAAAWSLKLMLLEGFPKDLHPGRLHERAFPLDGGTSSLSAIRRQLERDDADFRAALLLPCACLQDASLPAQPFAANTVRGDLGQRLDDYVADDRRVTISVADRCIVYSPRLWQLRERLTADYHRRHGDLPVSYSTVLLGHTGGRAHRRLQDAIGYRETSAPPRGLTAMAEGIHFLWRPLK